MDIYFWLSTILLGAYGCSSDFRDPPTFFHSDPLSRHYGIFPDSLRAQMLEETKKMFHFGYDSYMKHAFPMDELDPIHCTGRGPDYADPSNININDVLGDYALTLVDTLDTLAVMGNASEFKRAVKRVIDHVSFDKTNTVQVFEANIRILGGLLSAHFLMEDEAKPFGDLTPDWYMGDLVTLAHDLADRLILAFENAPLGVPHPRVNLVHGVPLDGFNHSCTAGAGSLILELGMLSRLLGDPIYESYARRAMRALWKQRDPETGLFGNVFNIHSGEWISKTAGLGAGIDSFYEYLLKSYILFQDAEDLSMFVEVYSSIKQYMRRGREECNRGFGTHPIYVNVEMENGNTATNWIDSLQAAFPGIQVLHGDIDEAICHHALYYAIWKRYDCLPERFNWKMLSPDVKFYPLRPELVESTYFLYRATKNPFYLHVGKDILTSLNEHTKSECGYATVHDVEDKSLEDRQESFFLSETCKYLYLLFDEDNPMNKFGERYLFTTEGHILPISKKYRRKIWEEDDMENMYAETAMVNATKKMDNASCQNLGKGASYGLPLKPTYLSQVFEQVGLRFQFS